MTIAQLPTSKRGWLALVRELGIRPAKGRGQNFLHDAGIVNRIVKVAGVTPADVVVEIGAGLGILTSRLAETARRVIAIEIDRQLAAHLDSAFAAATNVEVLHADAMTIDLAEVGGDSPLKVVANLPYSAAAAIAQRVLEADIQLASATFMVQREVGLRMLAKPPDMSILGVATQLYARGRIAFDVPPEVFEPRPTVESIVIHLVPHPTPLVKIETRRPFFALVNAGFRHRRKNVANSLADEIALPKSTIVDALSSAGIEPTRRAQTLTVAEWLALLRTWKQQDIGSLGE